MIRPSTIIHAATPHFLPCAIGIIFGILTFALFAVSATNAQPTPPAGDAREAEKIERQRELGILKSDLERTKETEAKLKAEIAAIKDDRKKFAQTLLDTAGRIRTIETLLSAAEARMAALEGREAEIRRSLDSRRALLAEVLAALTKLGRQPAPALMFWPEQALESVRSAILLGALIPELRAGAEVLVADLNELSRVRNEIAAERNMLNTNLAELEKDRYRLAALIDERQHRQIENEKALETERVRVQLFSRQVESVSELVSRMEKEIASAAKAAEAARRQTETKASLAALSDPGRITPAIPFAQAKGRLPFPVTGTPVRQFGAPDGLGGTEKGVSIAARPGGQISAPCDGWVVYAGQFRSYGRLLIINAGSGYHILLAGMERITVDLGQFVLTGEPVAVMGSGPRLASATAVSSSQPILYVEFRKDGNSIDPSSWWAKTEDEKVRG